MAEEQAQTVHGMVKVYFPLKGYGFITRAPGKDVFFYRTSVNDESALLPGCPVSFELVTTEFGVQAKNVTRTG